MSATKSVLFLAALAIMAVQGAAPARATNILSYVSSAGSFTNDCQFPIQMAARQGPGLTLRQALALPASGGGILIATPGASDGFLVIDRSINITHDGGSHAQLSSFVGTNVITINAGAGDFVTLRGLTVDGRVGGAGLNGIVVQQASAVHVQNCLIRS